jgi:hypothetical protein
VLNNSLNFSDVVLAGGTGRSGTTIIGKLLSRHSAVGLARPSEIRVLTYGNGLLDLHLGNRVGRYRHLLVTDTLHLARFKYRLFNDWWERESKTGGVAGLIQGIDHAELQELYGSMKKEWKTSRRNAPAHFFRSFVDSQKASSGKQLWIDTTPANLFRAKEIAAFLPNVRFIHMVRDGRDVISSVVREPWGPKNYNEGLVWYRQRMRRNLLNSTALGTQVLTMSLEDLVIKNRAESLREVLEFLQLETDSKIQKYFESEVRPERISQGRWRTDVSNVSTFNARYHAIVEELKEIDSELPLEV